MNHFSQLLIILGILLILITFAILAWCVNWAFGAIILGFELITLGAITPTSDTEE